MTLIDTSRKNTARPALKPCSSATRVPPWRGRKWTPQRRRQSLEPQSGGTCGDGSAYRRGNRNAQRIPASRPAMISSMTAAEAAVELDRTLEVSRARLLAMARQAAAERPEGKWSRKEILGHLIDSAANNHQRFVRLQHEEMLVYPSYRGDEWV